MPIMLTKAAYSKNSNIVIIIISAVKWLISINHIQNKKNLFTYYVCYVYLCIYKYTHANHIFGKYLHVYV